MEVSSPEGSSLPMNALLTNENTMSAPKRKSGIKRDWRVCELDRYSIFLDSKRAEHGGELLLSLNNLSQRRKMSCRIAATKQLISKRKMKKQSYNSNTPLCSMQKSSHAPIRVSPSAIVVSFCFKSPAAGTDSFALLALLVPLLMFALLPAASLTLASSSSSSSGGGGGGGNLELSRRHSELVATRAENTARQISTIATATTTSGQERENFSNFSERQLVPLMKNQNSTAYLDGDRLEDRDGRTVRARVESSGEKEEEEEEEMSDLSRSSDNLEKTIKSKVEVARQSDHSKQLDTSSNILARSSLSAFDFNGAQQLAVAAAAVATAPPSTTSNDKQPSSGALESSLKRARHLTRFRRNAGGEQRPLVAFNQPPNQERLLAFWLFFQATYPALSSHLLALSSVSGDLKQLQLHDRSGLIVAQNVLQMLTEADKLLRDSEQLNFEPTIARLTNPLRAKQNPLLARLVSNPIYAKLYQQIQRQRSRQQQQHRFKAEPTASASKGTEEGDNLTNGAERNSPGHSYGRIVHYPHELTDSSDSVAPTRTLDKLKLLNAQHKASQSDHLTSNEIDRQLATSELQLQQQQQLESNMIPQLDSERDSSWLGNHRQKSLATDSSSGNESPRNKFVYGNVLFRPPVGHKGANSQQQYQQQLNSINTLRQLSKASQVVDTNGQSLSPATVDATRLQMAIDKANESYGRLLVSPQSLLDSYNNPVRQQHVDKSATERVGSSELVKQPHDSSMAAHGPNGADEFEGDFHSEPMAQISVRPLEGGQTARTIINSSGATEFLID